MPKADEVKNEGSIAFFEENIGELKTRPNVSDDYYDTKNSVFNPAAAIERRIQIIAISSVSSAKNLKKELPEIVPETIKTLPPSIEKPVISPQKELPKVIQDTVRVKSITKEIPPVIEPSKKLVPKIIQDTIKVKTLVKEIPVAKDQALDFAIQVSVHSKLVNAQATQKTLKQSFSKPVVIVNEGDSFKVRISGFNTYEEAKLMLPKLSGLGFGDSFVVSPKKK